MKLLYLLSSAIFTQVQKKRFTQEDLIQWPRPTGYCLSPANTHAIYFTTTYDLSSTKNIVKAYLSVFHQKDNKFTNVSTSDISSKFNPFIKNWDSAPELVWIEDESVLFSSNDMFYVLYSIFNTNNYEVEKLKGFNSKKEHQNIRNLKYVQANKKLLFSAIVNAYGINNSTTTNISNQEKNQLGSGKLYDSLFVRHWDKYTTVEKRHIFSLNLECMYSEGKHKTCIVKERAHDVVENKLLESPISPDSNSNDFDFSYDGKQIAFVSKSHEKDDAWTTSTKLYISDVNINKPPRLIHQGIGQLSSPVFSYDGKYLCWLERDVPQYESAKNNIITYNIKNRETKRLFQWFDRSPSSISFSLDSKSLLVLVEDSGLNKLYKLKLKTRKITDLTDLATNLSVDSYMLFKNNGIIYSASSIDRPPEYYMYDLKNNIHHQLTHINTKNIKETSLSKLEQKWFEGALDDNVHAFIVYPPSFTPWRYYPAVLLIHGGPQGAWLNQWSYRWNPNIFANAGYVVFMVNFHGSTGYGQKFQDSIQENWGTHPFEDIMIGLQVLLKSVSQIDERRICALGASYGGYMVNWLNSKTDRFRCFVNHDGMFSTVHQYYTTDELYFPEHEFKGTPFENYENYEKFSPSNYVFRWKTPTLVIHGGKDYRLDLGEGLSTFTALQRRGIISRFLYFPDENHWVLKHLNSLQWHNEILDWLNMFCRPMFEQKLQLKINKE